MQNLSLIRTGALAASTMMMAMTLQAGSAFGQSQQTVVLGAGNPSVQVDLSVLDQLGPQQTVPGLLQPNIPLEVTRRGNRYPSGQTGGGGDSLLQSLRIQPGQPRPIAPPMAAPRAMAHQPMAAPQPRPAFQQATSSGQIKLRQPSGSTAKPTMAPVAKPAAPAKPKMAAVAPSAPPPPKVPAPPKTEPVKAASTPTKVTPTPSAAPPKPKLPEASVKAKPATQTASVPKKAEDQTPPTSGDSARISFTAGDSALPGGASGQLDPLIKQMKDDDALRVQLKAYASADGDSASRARRLSLSRALSVRAYLIEHGIRSTRMDVRALGSKVGSSGPADRVDVILVKR